MVDVILVTYNHESFIKDTLDCIAMQKTDFKFNVIVADDSSTDDTLKIIKEFSDKSEIEFIFLEPQKNLGITKNYQRAFSSCKENYIAVIEGDDLWTSPKRLQRHIDFLEEHRECAMSFNRYIVSNFEDSKFYIQPTWDCPKGYHILTSRDLARDNFIGNFSTCVYRKKYIDTLPKELFSIKAYDWITNICIGENGMIGFLTEEMNMYRLHSNGTWSSKDSSENTRDTIRCIDLYNELTNFKFEFEFNEYKERLKLSLILDNKVIQQSKGSTLKYSNKFKGYVPPIVLWIVKLFIPEKILCKFKAR